MDISNIGKQGHVDRSSERPKRADGKREYVIPSVARDEAKISEQSRETAAAVEGLAERARGAGGDRAERIAAAKAKLLRGELDAPAALQGSAQRLLAAKFLDA